MGFPVHVYGNYGDEKDAQSTKIGSLPLGTRMILPDGRIFAHARASTASAAGAGLVCQQAATAAASARLCYDVAASADASGKVINVTLGGTTAVTLDQFEDGYIFVNDGTGYGEGNMYKVKGNNSGAVSTTVEFQLEYGDTVKVALGAGTSLVGLRRNEFDHFLIRAAGTGSVGIPAGVTTAAISAGWYCWLQRRGPACVLSAGTLSEVGFAVASATVTAGGMQKCMPTVADTTTSPQEYSLGWCLTPATGSTDYEFDYLTLD